jgi:phosphoserine phosphatase
VLLSVHGSDRPGIAHAMCRVLAKHRVPIIDIEQASTHRLLSLSFLVDTANLNDDAGLIQELLFEGWQLGAEIKFTPVSEADLIGFSELTERVNQNLAAVTLIGKHVGAEALATVTGVLARRGVNITNIHKLSRQRLAAVDMIASVPASESFDEVKRELLLAAQGLDVDVAVQRENLYRRSKRLVVFDMDSTLIEQEVIDEMARALGCYDAVSAITERAMRGDLDFHQALQSRVALFRGADLARLVADVSPRLELKPGAKSLVQVLKKLGYRLAVISGGFTAFVETLRVQLQLDYAYANELEVNDGKLTGRIVGEIVDRQRKADLLGALAQREGVPLDQVMAVGDGANDLAMLARAGLGVAFNAKKSVREAANVALNQDNMASLLYLLGIREDELGAL